MAPSVSPAPRTPVLLPPARRRLNRLCPFVAIAAVGIALVAAVWIVTLSRLGLAGAEAARAELLLAVVRTVVLLALTGAAIAGFEWHGRSMRLLARAQARYRQIFANTTDCMFIVEVTPDNRFRLEALNPAEEAATGLSSPEIAGRYVEDVVGPANAEAVISRYTQCLQAQAAIRYEQRLELAGGARDFLTTLVPVRDSNGRIAGIVGVAREITDLKRAQEAIRRLNDHLEEHVAERTMELAAASAALAAAKDEVERASLAKSGFLARVSHEIRTPMNGVLGALELLAQSKFGAGEAELVASARDSGVALLALLNDVLDMAKIEAGRMEIVPASVSIAALVERTLATHRVNARRKGLELSARIDSRLPEWVNADEMRLGQILGNLVSNAIKFTRMGSVRLEATFVEGRGDALRVRFRVIDTGCGIETCTLERLFRPFEQGPEKDGLGERGTGLGLAISRALCERMGGTLSLESKPGAGTAATLELDVTTAAPQQLAEESPLPGGVLGARVLVADDHPTNRMILARQLATLGCIADACADGAEALRCFEEHRHELVITDCEMPVMDGYELARAIRQSERGDDAHPLTPIIACSAHPRGEIEERCRDSGIDAVLQKPVLLADLAAALVAHLPQVQSFDRAQLACFAGEDEVLRREFLIQFRESCLEDAPRLWEAVEMRDRSALARFAHRLRGAARTVGASRLAQASELMEHAARAGDWTRVAAAMPILDRALRRTLADVDAA